MFVINRDVFREVVSSKGKNVSNHCWFKFIVALRCEFALNCKMNHSFGMCIHLLVSVHYWFSNCK